MSRSQRAICAIRQQSLCRARFMRCRTLCNITNGDNSSLTAASFTPRKRVCLLSSSAPLHKRMRWGPTPCLMRLPHNSRPYFSATSSGNHYGASASRKNARHFRAPPACIGPQTPRPAPDSGSPVTTPPATTRPLWKALSKAAWKQRVCLAALTLPDKKGQRPSGAALFYVGRRADRLNSPRLPLV